MTKKFIFTTDQHYHLFTEFSTPDDTYVTSRFKEQIDSLKQTFELARKHKADLIFGGDLFHKRGAVDTRVFNQVFHVFASNPDVTVHMVRGNHDSVTNSLYTESSIDTFDALPNVSVYSTPEVYVSNLVNILFIPYGDETDVLKEAIKEFRVSESRTSILVGHLGLEGASTGLNSHRLSGAFTLGDLRPEAFDFILLGHYHKPQNLGGHPYFIYGGSATQNSFSDEGDAHGVHLITVEEDRLENSIEFIPLDAKGFVTIKGGSIPPNIDEIIEKNYVRFIGTKEQAKAVDKIVEEESLNTFRVMIERDYTQQARIGIDSSSSPEEVTREYASQYFPNAVEEGLECLREAK